MTNRTLRVIVKAHRGGNQVRVRLTNRFGTAPLTVSAVKISTLKPGAAAGSAPGSAIVDGSSRVVKFGGSESVSIPAGLDRASDAVAFSVADGSASGFAAVAIDVHFSGTVASPTRHRTALQTSYSTVNGKGDKTGWYSTPGDATNPFTETLNFSPLVSGLDVQAPGDEGTVVALGDSLTDGTGSGTDRDERYTDWLQRRLDQVGSKLTVVNAGIGGGYVLQDGVGAMDYAGQSMRKRVGLDVLATETTGNPADSRGVSDVLVLGGANDMGQINREFNRFARWTDVTHGLGDIYAALHARGLNVVAVTIPPTGGAVVPSYGDFWMGNDRRNVNNWIRTSAAQRVPGDPSTDRFPDAFFDMSEALRDADDFGQINEFVTLDQVHPNGAGYRRFVDYVFAHGQQSGLRGPACAR